MSNAVTITLNVRDNASGVLRGLQGILGQNAIAGAAMGSAITGALNGAKAAVGGLTSALSEAMEIQSSNISTAGDFMKLTGKSYAESIGFVDSFGKRMEALANDLPGVTAEYVKFGKGITDNLLPAFKNLDGSLQENSFKAALDEISKSASIRVATGDSTTAQAVRGVSRALQEGKTIAELERLKFFMDNPAVISLLKQETEKQGKSFESMSARQRAELLQKALAVPEEVINASKESIAGLLEGFRSSLLSPQTGLFGLLRDTDLGLSGDQSVFAALNVTVKKVLGPGGLFDQMAQTMKALGFSADPMKALFSGITRFNAWLDGFEISKLLNMANSFDGAGLGRMAGEMGGELLDNLIGLDWGRISDAVGEALTGMINYLSNFAIAFPVSRVVHFGFVVVGAVFDSLTKGLSSLSLNDWGNVLLAALKGLGVVLAGMLVGGVVVAFGGLVIAVAAAIAYLVTTIVQDWELIRTTWAQWFGQFGEAMGAAFNWAISQVGAGAQFITDSISNLFKAISEKIANLIPDIPNPLRAGTGVRKGSASATKGPKVPNAAGGLNFGGLFGAMAREMAAMPNGANPVVANSAETILNPRQVAGLIAGIQGLGRGGGSSLNISGGLHFHGAEVSDPEAMAQAVMSRIEREWQRFSNSKMSAAY
jgi:signal transduction histidine kinase